MSLGTCSSRRIPSLRCLAIRCLTQRVHNTTLRSTASTPPLSSEPPISTKVESHSTLPPTKLRALVALYHQAESWITPETLDKAIDKAFVPDAVNAGLSLPSQEGIGWQELVSTLADVKKLPRMAQLEADATFRRLGPKHTAFPKREELMLEALYGVQVHDNKVLPGLEVVQEMEKGLKLGIDEDKKREDRSDINDLLEQ